MAIQRSVDWLLGREQPDDIPHCPDHDEPMELFKKVGKPARYNDQETETYSLLFRCPVPGCNQTAVREWRRTQIPVPGAAPPRPRWALRRNKSI
jgi:hypothetical protein